MPDLSIVLVSFNCRAHLRMCLDSILRQTDLPRTEVIVVDNASSDHTVSMLRGDFPLVITVANERNLGFAGAANQAIAMSQGRYVLLLNPDTIIPTGGLSRMVQLMHKNQGAGAAGCRLVTEDGTPQPSAMHFTTVTNQIAGALPLVSRIRSRHLRHDCYEADSIGTRAVADVDFLCGAFLLLRRDALTAVGPLDERFFMYAEDEDWCYRARLAGWRIIYTPRVAVVHRGGGSKRIDSFEVNEELVRSRYKLLLKHRGRLHASLYRLALVAGAAIGGVSACAHKVLFPWKTAHVGRRLRCSWRLARFLVLLRVDSTWPARRLNT